MASTEPRPRATLDSQLRTKWSAARVWAAREVPYLASALLALDPVVVADPPFDMSALPTDPDWHVYLDPAVIEALDIPVIGFWLVHQVSHLLRGHAGRYPGPRQREDEAGHRTPPQHQWNLAGDCEINDDLIAGRVARPPDAITPSVLGLPDGLLAEQYWDALGGGEQQQEEAPGDCGSGCDGLSRSWDSGRPGLSATEQKLLGREVARRIAEHQRSRGDVSAGWQRWANEILEPTVNWRRLLTAAIRRGVADTAGRVDFTYQRPSRRLSSVKDVVLPSLRQPTPQVAIVLDTSGSMNDQMLAQALAEISGVLRSLGVGRRNLKALCCDARPYRAHRLLDPLDLPLEGGGGTDMSAGLSAASALRPRPDLVIVLTDGFTPWPAEAPRGSKVIIGLMDPAGRVPDWATVVPIDPDDGVRGS